MSLVENFDEARDFVKKTASSEALTVLEKLAEDYQARHNLEI